MEETQKFIKSMVFVDAMEGGYTGPRGLPDDPGKETNWGVTQKTWTRFCWAEKDLTKNFPTQVKDITKSQARAYYLFLWENSYAEDLAWPLCLVYFDACVNQSNALELLQRAMDVTTDGDMGPQTQAAMKLSSSSISSSYMTSYRLMLVRVFKYDELDKNNPKLTKFLTTLWINRIKHLFQFVEEALPPNGSLGSSPRT